MKLKTTLQAVALCCGLMGMGSSQAAAVMQFSSLNDTGSILYSASRDGATLSATVLFTLTAISAKSATFGVHVSNDSFGPGANTLTSFGIDVVSPDLKKATATGGWGAGMNQTLPGFQKVDLCLWPGNNCSGGGNSGLGEGAVADFSLTLTTSGNFLTSGISFEGPYGAKFQRVGNGGKSFEFAGCIVGSPNCGPMVKVAQVPEPASLALIGLGLLGTALVRRRRA